MTSNRRRAVQDDSGAKPHSPTQKLPVPPLIFRTTWWPLSSLPFIGLFALFLLALTTSNGIPQWPIVVLEVGLLGALLLLTVWAFSCTLELTESGVRKHFPLLETREIPYSQIRHIKVMVMVLRSRTVERVYLLWITDIRGGRIVVDMRMYRDSDLTAIVDALATRAPQARINQQASMVQAGQFGFRH